jgi:uncharacterized protein (DUF4415 family)
MSMTDEKIIEVEVTVEDLEKMRAEGIAEKELPEIGIRHYRPARHIIKNRTAILLDSDIAEYFKKRAEEETGTTFQTHINNELRSLIEKREDKTDLRQELLNDKDFLQKLKEKLAA